MLSREHFTQETCVMARHLPKGGSANYELTSSNRRKVQAPSTPYRITQRVEGIAGEALTFEILYRSRRESNTNVRYRTELISDKGTLQMLGCIPQTPSPEPRPSDTTAGDLDKDAKIRDLEVGDVIDLHLCRC